ncbi:hypothetical protein HGB25_03460 [Candidatus Saccharibacteria bacterium]|nr:hypothetical protein [Candidatus Saccharibacteria bacterium]
MEQIPSTKYFVSEDSNHPETIGNVAAIQFTPGWDIDSKGFPTGELHQMIDGLPRIAAYAEKHARETLGSDAKQSIEEAMSEGQMSRLDAVNHYFGTVAMSAMIEVIDDSATDYAMTVTDAETAKIFATKVVDKFISDSEIVSELRQKKIREHILHIATGVKVDQLALSEVLGNISPKSKVWEDDNPVFVATP